MIAALARAARVFRREDYLEAGRRAARFVSRQLTDGEGRLMHRFREGEAGLQANLDDYAFMIWGWLELYQATFEVEYLAEAVNFQNQTNTRFWDDESGGFFFTPVDGEGLIARQKDAYDGAAPSGNSVALRNLLRLARLTGSASFDEQASKLLRAFAPAFQKLPSGFTAMLAGLDMAIGPVHEIVVVGKHGAADTRALLEAIDTVYDPNTVVLLKHPANAAALADLAPFTKSMEALTGKATVYVCENFHCNQPVTEPTALHSLLTP
jgi:uncharacterized protein YyaL (SSP411 family)